MACGCGRKARAAAAGKEIRGYRVTLPNGGGVVPPVDKPPFFSPAEARSEVRAQGGGTVNVEYKT